MTDKKSFPMPCFFTEPCVVDENDNLWKHYGWLYGFFQQSEWDGEYGAVLHFPVGIVKVDKGKFVKPDAESITVIPETAEFKAAMGIVEEKSPVCSHSWCRSETKSGNNNNECEVCGLIYCNAHFLFGVRKCIVCVEKEIAERGEECV